MQKVATKVFTYASMVFGVLGLLIVAFGMGGGIDSSYLQVMIYKTFAASIIVILTSFAISVAGKYLQSNEGEQ